jgi:hypothetical protein
METVMKHMSFQERKLEEVQEIADREGRNDYDVIREAVAQYLQKHESDSKIHTEVPQDGVIRPQDKALNLSFNEMWSEDGVNSQDPSHGDVVRAIEDGGDYFTYYKFVWIEGYFVCQQVAPMTYDLLDQLSRRTDKYRV